MVEGMLLHGILHRVEADSGNARAWVGDVRDAVETEGVSSGEVTLMEFVWGDMSWGLLMLCIRFEGMDRETERNRRKWDGRSWRRSCSGV